MKSVKLTLLLIAVVLGFSRCSTDVDLNAPYQPYTVVFGLLDPELDTQIVRINKTWLGEGNNFDYALIRDSSEYDFSEFEATIGRYVNDQLQEEWVLDSITLDDKHTDGLFYAPEYTAYYFVDENGLNLNQNGSAISVESDWRLNIDFINKDDVSASTRLASYPENNANITQPPAGQGANFNFGMATVIGSDINFGEFDFKWTSAPNAGRYELSIIFHYDEVIWETAAHEVIASMEHKEFNWFIGTVEAPITGVETLSKEVSWESFFRALQSRLEADPLITRHVGIWDPDDPAQDLPVLDVVLTLANQDLDTYLDVNAPVTGIIQERPEYTNVTNGIGLFASRGQQIAPNFSITNNSMQALVLSEFTQNLNFCSNNPFSDDACD